MFDVDEIASWFDNPEDVKRDLENSSIEEAVYQTGSYSGDWKVVYWKLGQRYEASGDHCSCNSPHWDPV